MLFAKGKPRPGLIVQTDEIKTPVEIIICPFTTTLIDAPLYRPMVRPSADNGLTAQSQLMADKIGPTPRSSLGNVIGRLSDEDLLRLEIALVTILDLHG